jgi:hypothetical protein
MLDDDSQGAYFVEPIFAFLLGFAHVLCVNELLCFTHRWGVTSHVDFGFEHAPVPPCVQVKVESKKK